MLEQKFVEWLNEIQAGIGKAAPQAMELAIQHERWEGIGCLGAGVFLCLLTLTLWITARKVAKATDWDDTDDMGIPITMTLFAGGAIAIVPGLCNLLNIWNWVAIFDPKLALAHDVIVKLTN